MLVTSMDGVEIRTFYIDKTDGETIFKGKFKSMKSAVEAAVKEGVSLDGADLRYADLRGAYLVRADLSGADLRYARLNGAWLYCANLRDADMREAKMIGARLGGANLRYAFLPNGKGKVNTKDAMF